MSAIGSVFLGDVQQRHRLFSSSSRSPPASPSPPPSATSVSMSAIISQSTPVSPTSIEPSPSSPPLDSSLATVPMALNIPPEIPALAPAPTIDPELSLELRLRWLEAIILGTKQGEVGQLKHGETLLRNVEDIQRRLNIAVEGNDALKKFMDHYDQNASFLTPSFALSSTLPSEASSLSDEELDALLTDLAPEIRSADHDMLEITTLVNTKTVISTGKLADYEMLEPRVKQVMEDFEEDFQRIGVLETRVGKLMERNATLVDALSELFVVWDDALTDAEVKLARLKRIKQERKRLGME